MTATFTACYIVEDASERQLMTPAAMVEYVKDNAGEYTFYVWHIQADVPPRDVTEDMLDLYQVDAPDDECDDDAPRGRSQFDEHNTQWGA